ncbi:DUF6429 family protein [Paracoccus haematequi]
MTSGARGRASTGNALERLHARGLIADPVSKAKSVILTDESLR